MNEITQLDWDVFGLRKLERFKERAAIARAMRNGQNEKEIIHL